MTKENDLRIFHYKGCPIHYRLAGLAGAPLVVLTHGGMVDHRVWDMQVPAFSSRDRLLLWDVRGHGRSRPGGQNRTVPRVAEDLAALLDHLGYKQAVLVGLSAGGMLVQEFACCYPDRVTALVVAGQTCWTQPPREVRLMLSSWPATLWVFISLLVPWNLFIRILERQGAAFAKPNTQAYLREVFGRWSKARFVRHSWYGRGGLRFEPDYRIRQPLLIIHGEYEMAFVRREAAAWAEREARCHYEVIPCAGHVVNMDNPEAFNARLLAFLAELEEEANFKQR
jgi:3-oxoadipate enol-lactonase